MKVRRFFYVAAPYGTRLHIQFGRSHSEDPVACGRQSQPGWSWWRKRKGVRIPLCKQCEASA